MSSCEFFSVDLQQPLTDLNQAKTLLDNALPAGLDIIEISPLAGKLVQDMICTYQIEVPHDLSEAELEMISGLDSIDSMVVERIRKGRRKLLDIRPLINSIRVSTARTIILELISKSAMPGTKPAEALATLLHLDEETVLKLQIMKISWSELEN